jgi:hypothetical protein
MSNEEIIALLNAKLEEANCDSERATSWHKEVLFYDHRLTIEAMAHVTKASTQATLLQSLLDEIEGKPIYSLWDQ